MEIKLIIAIVLGIIVLALFGYDIWTRLQTMPKEQRVELAKGMALSLVFLAEDRFGSRTGPIKYSWVVLEIYKALPPFIAKYITLDILDDAIEWAVEEMKKMLK